MVTPARLAADIVRSLEPGAVTFEGGEDEVEISAARSRFVVRTYPVEDFPVLPDPRPDQVTAAGRPDWPRRCARWSGPPRTTTPGPCLTGVLVAAEGSGTRLVATDSYRLALRDLTGTGPLPEGTDQILIPARALTELQRLLPAAGSKDAGKEKDEAAPTSGSR